MQEETLAIHLSAQTSAEAPTPPHPEAAPCPLGLTPREQALMQGLAAGHTSRQIACALHRSEKTIRNQLTYLYQKLGAHNRAEAVAIYLRAAAGNLVTK